MIIMSMTTKIIKPYLNSEHSFLYRFRLFSSVWKIDISCHLWLFFDRNSLKMLFIAQLFKISACMSRRYDCLTILMKLETASTHDLTREEICWLQSQLRILFSMEKLQIQKYIISERRYLLNITHSVCIRPRLRLNNFNLKIPGRRARG